MRWQKAQIRQKTLEAHRATQSPAERLHSVIPVLWVKKYLRPKSKRVRHKLTQRNLLRKLVLMARQALVCARL